jgi:hypothetical protein
VYKIKLDYAVRYGYSIRWFSGTIDLAGCFLFKKLMFQLFQIHIYSFCVASQIYLSHKRLDLFFLDGNLSKNTFGWFCQAALALASILTCKIILPVLHLLQ